MNPVIVIPTFVSARRRKEGGSVLTTYDHATPISQPGELPRLLASLQKVRGAGQIIVLVVSEPSIENQAAEKVQSVVSRFPSLNTVVIGAPELALIQQRMAFEIHLLKAFPCCQKWLYHLSWLFDR